MFTTLLTETIQVRKMLYGLLRKVNARSEEGGKKDKKRGR